MMTIGCFAPLLLFLLAFVGASAAVSNVPVEPEVVGTPESSAPILAISALPALDPKPADYAQAAIKGLDLAYKVGVRGMFLSDKWSDLEPFPEKYRLDDLANSIAYLGQRGFTVELALQVLNTTAKETPSDLMPMSFNSKRMKDRFHALIDALLPRLNRHVAYLSIGNEVDVYLAAHGGWTAYKEFYDDAVAYVHNVTPWLKIGVTGTFIGATGASADDIAALNESSDVWILTYYPLKPEFMVKEPTVPLVDIPRMVTLARGRPLILQEVGYPTSPLLGSTGQKQADFVANVYSAWRAESGHIPFLNFFVLHDFTPKMCDDFTAYYELPYNANFYEFLCSLGLRKADGTPKPGWKAFVDGASGI
jgi:hypothetical protein